MARKSFSLLNRMRAWLNPAVLHNTLVENETSGGGAALLLDRPLRPDRPRPAGRLIWFHDSSVGSAAQLGDLAAAMDEEAPGLSFLLTSHTHQVLSPAAMDIAILQQRPPVNTPGGARAFLDHWKPDLAVFFASALPPALVAEAAQRAMPIFAICDTALPASARPMLRRLDKAFAVDDAQAEILRRRGLPDERTAIVGPLYANPPVPLCNETERENFARLLAGRPVWLAAQTTAIEDVAMIGAHAGAARLAHRLLLILVPDDPMRGTAVVQELRARRWRVAQRSADEEPDDETQVYVADTEGEMGLWYRLAPVSFMGGSLDGTASHPADPAIPAALGSAILHGPNTGPYAQMYQRLDMAKASRIARDGEGLTRLLNVVMAPDKAAVLAQAAWEVSSGGAETISRIAETLLAALDAKQEHP